MPLDRGCVAGCMVDSKESNRDRPRGFWLVVVLLGLEAGMRIAIFFASFNMELVERDVPQWTLDFSIVMFMVLGIAGLVLLYPLVQGSALGYYGTLGICIGTIIFDIWGMFAVQSSAAMGIVVPVIATVFLLAFKDRILTGLPEPTD